MNQTFDTFSVGVTRAWTNFMAFIPELFLFLVILVVGYFVAKFLGKGVAALLRRLDFNRFAQKSYVQRMAGDRSYDYAGILGTVTKWIAFLFVLQLAFGVFPNNPISAILTNFIMYLPSIFYAVVILVLASFLAAGVQRLLLASLARLSFGRAIASLAAGFIVAIGIFAALDELGVARTIVDGLFFACLAIIVGAGIISIGCGGIAPMRAQWERALGRLQREGQRMRTEENLADRARQEVEAMRQESGTVEEVHPAEAAPGYRNR